MKSTDLPPLTIRALRAAYAEGQTHPVQVIGNLFDRIAAEAGGEAWICLRERAAVIKDAHDAAARLADPACRAALPLLGIPYAVKDNIDVAGLPTTAGCPDFAYVAKSDAAVVERLRAAGAILIGKTNLDQFATGLVGTRSPYGAVGNPFNPACMSGGSSSGSAAVTARGWVAFALGTDTAGSGRVPAGACNLVGVKPSTGLVSSHGVVPACRSLDCVSILAHTVEDGWDVLSVLAGEDERDPFSTSPVALGPLPRALRLGLPTCLEFYGDPLAEAAWQAALEHLRAEAGVSFVDIDLRPFHEVARLLYDGPWVAERRWALGEFMDTHAAALDATVRGIIAGGENFSAVDAFAGRYQLEALRKRCQQVLDEIDLMLVPTAPTLHTHAAIAAEPVARNSELGRYTNFVNLLGMAGLSIPGPFRADGLPAGITLLGVNGSDYRLAEFGRRLQARLHQRLGMSTLPPPPTAVLEPLPSAEAMIELAVVGAHLHGLPLNWQLVERNARLLQTTRTAPDYRLYALPGTTPPKPGLVRVASGGRAIEVEIWRLPLRYFGSFVAGVAAPLGIGSLQLADGRWVKGFICEAAAVAEAQDISAPGGWRAYLATLSR
ncbi:allophanate hydrolase [Betaproteobacteria bacterium]|nr:allophanate hydrolase [Betaproteobacteria bacterium]